MDLGLKGKSVLVTGGTHGIGLAIALELASEGCDIVVCSRTQEHVDQAVKLIEEKGSCGVGEIVDVLNPNDIDRVIATIINEWGGVDILINNVGGGGRWGLEDVVETDESVWMDVYNKNAMAAVRFTMAFLPCMIKRNWGRVVTITSTYGREGGGRPWFNMAKCAQTSLMKTLAMNPDLSRYGITFNSVAPGAIMIPDTGWEEEMINDPEGFKRRVEKQYPLGRIGTPEEVAAVVAFVCSEKASLINGAAIAVDGAESRSF